MDSPVVIDVNGNHRSLNTDWRFPIYNLDQDELNNTEEGNDNDTDKTVGTVLTRSELQTNFLIESQQKP